MLISITLFKYMIITFIIVFLVYFLLSILNIMREHLAIKRELLNNIQELKDEVKNSIQHIKN